MGCVIIKILVAWAVRDQLKNQLCKMSKMGKAPTPKGEGDCLLRKGEVGLTLVLGLNNQTRILELTNQSRHLLIRQLGTLGNLLLDLGHSVQTIGGHTVQNGGLDTLVDSLLSSGLLLGRVLLGEQFDLVVDETQNLVHGDGANLGIGRGLDVGTDGGEILALGHLLHSINPFWFVRFSFLFVILLYHKSGDLSIPF